MILAIDIGGTRTRLALFSEAGAKAPLWSEEFASDYCYASFLEDFRSAYRRLGTRPTAAGVSFGVSLSADGSTVLAAGKMGDYQGKSITRDLEAILGCPVTAAHDCVCGVIAEKHLTSGADGDLAYVTVSSGTGGAVCLRWGARHVAFRVRLAHHIIDHDGPMCRCGQRGCLAAFTDGIELQKRLRQPLAAVTDVSTWTAFGEALAVGLVNLSWMFSLDLIILGGGIIEHNTMVRYSLESLFESRRSTGRQKACSLRMSSVGPDSVLRGAALLASRMPAVQVIHH